MTQSTVIYFSYPTITINGSAAPANFLEDILEISVEESLHQPAMFTLMVRNDYFPGRDGENVWAYDDLLAIGTSIEISFTSSTSAAEEFSEGIENSILQGEITGLEVQFTGESQAPIIIRGYDVFHRLHRGRYNRSFQNKKDSDIVSDVISEIGISKGTIDDTGGPYGFGDPVGYVFQENQTNMEFLRERAARNGFELFVQDGKLNFRKPTSSDTLELTWLEEIHSMKFRVSSAQQVSSVELRGWDYTQKQPIVSTKSSQTATVITDSQYGKGSDISSKFGSTPTMIVVDQQVSSQDEADAIAQAVYNELSGEFVYADAKCEGNPNIRPGRLVKLSGMGKSSGNYYITETRHLYKDNFYTTEFSVRGLRGGELSSTLSVPNRLQPGQTLLVGIVSNNQDPKKWGRVRVKFPTLTEDHESNWARVVGIGAGSSRGFDCLPEINDEVLVAFEHGDIHRPYIIGGVWNGQDAPPEIVDNSINDGKVRLRTFQTRTGHKLQFVEEDKDSSKAGVYIQTVYGHELDLNDSEKFIDIKTKGGHYALLDDQNKKIEIKTNGGHQILLDDSGSEVNMISTGAVNVKSGTSGASNDINLNAGNITLTATTQITLKVGSNKIEISQAGINIEGMQVTIKGNVKVDVQGALVSVQADGITQIKGSLVQIN